MEPTFIPPSESQHNNRLRRAIFTRADDLRMVERIDDAAIKSREEFVQESLPKLFGERIKPKQAQVECIQWIVFNQQDVTLTAKTGFGKSLIMQSVSFFFKHGVTVCILPLNAIGKEQESAITAAGEYFQTWAKIRVYPGIPE